MKDIEYYEVLKTCKFIANEESYFIEGTECEIIQIWDCFSSDDKFNAPVLMGTFKSSNNYAESCQLSEFYIYDKDGIEISDMTLYEYIMYSRNEVIRNLMDEGIDSGISDDFDPNDPQNH